MSRSILFSVAIVVSSLSTASSEENVFAVKVDKKAKSNGPAAANADRFYLAPELMAAQSSGAEMVGFNEEGQVLMRIDEPAKLFAQPMIQATEKSEIPFEKMDKPRLLIGFKSGQGDAVEAALKTAGFEILKKSERGKYIVVAGEKEKNGIISPSMIKAISKEIKESGAQSATPNYRLSIPEPNRPRPIRPGVGTTSTLPNDEFLNELWGLRNCNATMAWKSVTMSPVVVAVIDTGTQIDHPDLIDNIWINEREANGTSGEDDDGNGLVDDINGWDFLEDNNTVFDHPSVDSHGTHVAGTIGALTDNGGFGVVGMNWSVKIMPVKFLGQGGGSLEDAIDAIYYAVDQGATILNNSWGGGGYSPVLENAIKDANDRGVLFVAAAGNENNNNDANPSYPASYDVPNVISVASIDEPINAGGELRSGFSNYGATSVDLAAPGGNILSCIPNDTHAFYNGTSMATPHVSGALALMRGSSEHQGLSHLDLRQRLLDNARPAEGLKNICATGSTLDVGFLCNACDEQGVGGETVIASKTFPPGSTTISGNGTIAELEIELAEPSQVVVQASTSLSSSVDDTLVDLSLSSSSGNWSDAYRYQTLSRMGDWSNIAISHGTLLPAGKHRITWTASLNNSSDLNVDGGSLSVIAHPAGSANLNRGANQLRATAALRSRFANPNVSSRAGSRESRVMRTRGQMERMPQIQGSRRP
ncbi:MAG: S8 family peptidase [Pirellulaceae bacterium]